jgi:hypothetical protein
MIALSDISWIAKTICVFRTINTRHSDNEAPPGLCGLFISVSYLDQQRLLPFTCHKLNTDWQTLCSETSWPRNRRKTGMVQTTSAEQVRKPVNSAGVGWWRNTVPTLSLHLEPELITLSDNGGRGNNRGQHT